MSTRRTARIAVLAALVCAALWGGLTGCSRKGAPPPAPPTDLPQTLPSEEEAGSVQPGAGEAIPGAGESGARGEWPLPRESAGGAEDEGEKLYGFRVQLFATGNPELAQARAEEYRALFEEKVYVELEGLLYKIEVGDCRTREEAEALRRRALGAGCEGAFVVDALILGK
jgi:hypothetical protein